MSTSLQSPSDPLASAAPVHPLQAVQEARGWLTVASDDFPGPILVCLDRDALDATYAASRGLGTDWPPLPDGTYPPAPVFTPSEILELSELCNLCTPADDHPAAPSATQPFQYESGAEGAASTSSSPPKAARSGGLRPAQTAGAGGAPGARGPAGRIVAGPRGTWDRLALLRLVVHTKRVFGAKVVPLELWHAKNLEEDARVAVPWREIHPKAEPAGAPLTRKAAPW